nr:hypothetical protein CFP56_56196 [Quercus suber]
MNGSAGTTILVGSMIDFKFNNFVLPSRLSRSYQKDAAASAYSLPDKCLSGQITGMAKWSLAPYSLHRVQTIATQHLHLIYKPLARSSWKTHFFPSTNDMASTA